MGKVDLIEPVDTRPVRRLPTTIAIAVAVLAHLWLQAAMTLSVPGWNINTFRNYFAGDQLSYLAIVTDGSKGLSTNREPFTVTGSIYYPRAWYQFLGWISHVTGISPSAAWTVGGLTAQAALVAMIGLTSVLLTRRWYLALVAFVPFTVGTLADVQSHNWFTRHGPQAVLWGPFAALFTLNGETVGETIGAIAMLVIMLIVAGRIDGRAAMISGFVACTVVGLLASVQTYSFLASTYILGFAAAAFGLNKLRLAGERLLVPVAATAALAVLLFLVGPPLAASVGPLALLVLGLVPALPGCLALVRLYGRVVFGFPAGLAIGAAPQAVLTTLGLLGGDPFLSYRTVSSKNLGVPPLSGVVSALPVLVPLIGVLVAGIANRNALWFAVPAGGIAAWLLTSTNDLWGANQEPYRLWIDCESLLAAIGLPLVLWAGARYLLDRRTDPALNSADPTGTPIVTGRRRATAGAFAAATLMLFALALPDFRLWRQTATAVGYIDFTAPRMAAAAAAARAGIITAPGGLVATGPCIDRNVFKNAYGGPTVGLNAGLAWPDAKDTVTRVGAETLAGIWLPRQARSIPVGWVITDSACKTVLTPRVSATPAVTMPYNQNGKTGTMQAWRVPPP